MEIDWLKCELVESVEGRCGGKPTVAGTRIFPETIADSFFYGDTVDGLLEGFPSLSRAQIERLIEFDHEQRSRAAA